MKTGSIYIIKNKLNNKVYIGQTTLEVRERFMSHLKPSVYKKRRTYKIYNAMNKYGKENFWVEVLEEGIPFELLDEKEIYYIHLYDSYRCGYNSTMGGDGRIINKLNNEEEVLEMAKSGKGSKEIANILGCHKATVLRTLHKIGFYYHDDVDIKLIEKLFREHKTYKEIVEITGIPLWTIQRRAVKYGINKRKNYLKYLDNLEKIKKDIKNKKTIRYIMKKYHISRETIKKIKED